MMIFCKVKLDFVVLYIPHLTKKWLITWVCLLATGYMVFIVSTIISTFP